MHLACGLRLRLQWTLARPAFTGGKALALSVIGAGYGRTGTLSLKYALEALGYRKCHHMLEVINNPGEDQRWLAASRGEDVDWDDLFEGYQAAVDWPSCHFYRQLAEHYPSAKVVLTVRDPRSWFESMSNTTLRVIRQGIDSGRIKPEGNLGTELVVKAAFAGNIDDADQGIAAFNQHTAEVKASIDPERLLIFEVAQGWQPLCEFLERPIPNEPFPRVNSRDEFEGIFFGNQPTN